MSVSASDDPWSPLQFVMEICLRQISTFTFRQRRNISLAHRANITFAKQKYHISSMDEIYHCNATALLYQPCSVLLMMSSCRERERVVKSAL